MTNKPTILYVEDEEGIRSQLSKFFKNFCSRLYLAVDGKDGLRQYKKYNPDIVVSDIKMPKMDGIDMVKGIKGIDQNQPVIFTTAFSDSDFFIDAIDLNVDGYILKPIDLEKLEQKIEYITMQLNLHKQIKLQKTITSEIAKLQDNLLVVFDEHKDMIYSNEKFLEFFNLGHLDKFEFKCDRLSDMFLQDDDFFAPKSTCGEDWIAQIKTLESDKRVVSMLNSNTLTPQSFLVSVKTIEDTKHTIILFTEITGITREKKEFRRKAFRDELTKIYNRAYFDEELERQIATCKREKNPLSLFMLDIDKFKDFNDTYGHQVGDEILKELSKIVTKRTRAADTFARWGGEEFMGILPNSTLEQTLKIAENLRKIIENHIFINGLKVTCSFGVSTFLDDDTEETLVKRVDEALYRAKANGRNRVEWTKLNK